MRPFLACLFVCSLMKLASANTIPVAPTGSCGGDIAAIQNAVNAAQSRDVVQLSAGSYDFSCLNGGAGVFIGNPDITIQGALDQSVINGPGLATQIRSTAFFVGADAVSIDGVTFQGFRVGVFAGAGDGITTANHFSLTNSVFQNNLQSVFIQQDSLSPRIVGNTFLVPAPPSADIFSPFGISFGVIVQRDCSGLLLARNTITGPGVTAHFQSTDQLVQSPSASGVGIRTIGLLQADNQAPYAELGRVSDNTISNLDAGMQSSSNLGVVSHNVVTHNAIGITISNDTDDGVHQVSGNIVTENISSGNDVGIWIASGTANTITLNDVSHNSLAGLLFLANPGGAPSTGNLFHGNIGGKIVGAKGNSGF
jgi:parallel beta-helix repeat protein